MILFFYTNQEKTIGHPFKDFAKQPFVFVNISQLKTCEI